MKGNSYMSINQTMYYKPKQPKPATLLILDKTRSPKMITLHCDMTIGRQYPGSDRDIKVESTIVGRKHGEFIYDDSDSSYYYIDNNSLNGTFINGEKLARYNERGSKAYGLSDGDILRIDHENLDEPHPEAVLIVFSTAFKENENWKYFMLTQPVKITIGRGQECELRLNDLMASRSHAILQFQKNGWYIKDNSSTNGISLNGHEIKKTSLLHQNDVIRLANTMLIYNGHGLLYNSTNENKATLKVDIKEKSVSGNKLLLKDINIQFGNGDFVLILGSSGAGKTTLIKAILGESRANGKILLNGQDLYKNFKSMKFQIGMVPQFLTLRTNDTVRNTLMDTASIKLGRKYTKREQLERVDQVIKNIGIREHADKYIGQLSGGQQKKVSVANQLIGFQKVFICDEPDSGLDAASRMQQMEILKEISQEGKIVIVISHEPDDAAEFINGVRRSLFTKVVVLAKSSKDKAGHLAFFGRTDDALSFFNVHRLQDIMLEINPKTEGGRGKADEYIEKYEHIRG